MKIKWLVQDVGKNTMLHDNFNTLKTMGANYHSFGLIENATSITNLENILLNIEDNYIIRGGTKILHLLENYSDLENFCEYLTDFQIEHKQLFLEKLQAGIFYNANNFDQAYYNQLDLPLLNEDAFFLPIKEHKNTSFEIPYFIKPSQDLKAFLPGILQPGQTIVNFIENSQHLKQYDHELALLSKVKHINKEYRFFIVNEQVITGSQYKDEDTVKYNSFIPADMLSIAQEYCKLYQPHDIFTMDLAQTPEGVKIVEYNCWNGSGLYHCDKVLLFTTVQDYMKNAPKKSSNVLKKLI